jgi:hypothetical protein
VDTGNSINAAIFKLRHALRDDPENPSFIRTITGKGYQFIADPLEPRPEPQSAHPQPPATAGAANREELGTRRWWILIVIVTLVVLAAAVGMVLQRSLSSPPAIADRHLMLAVLPFENLTGDPTQDYFTDGFTEEMITRLGALDPRHLGVIARTSVMPYKESPVP